MKLLHRLPRRPPGATVPLLTCAAFAISFAADAPPPTDGEAYVKDGHQSAGHPVGGDQRQKILELWSDTPAYAALFKDPAHAKKPAKIQSTVAPVPPLVAATPGKANATVTVSFIVDEAGGVEAARVLESEDPRYNQSAIDAVRQWRFFPAEGAKGFVKSYFVVPIVFQGAPAEELAIRLAVGRPSRVLHSGIDLRPQPTPPPPLTHEWTFDVQLQGPGAKDVKAGRITITHAMDDTGSMLTSTQVPTYYHPAVGSISADDLVRTPLPPLNITVAGADPAAKTILAVEGLVELVIPRLDPAGANAVIENLPAHIGSALKSETLAAAGVTIVLYDKATCDRYLADKAALGGPRDFDSGNLFGNQPAWMPAPRSNGGVTESDLAIGISDPQGKLIGFEFQTVDGKPLTYDHNGWYHSADTDPPKKRFDVYRLGPHIPTNAKLVCWLITPRSLFKMPLKLAELPLPGSGK